jgi:omega-6 fatty acid desaturase / acyl-lipid omega-6 desaturase (Delta-12 desaturase)
VRPSQSDVGIVAALAAIGWALSVFGLKPVAFMYLFPYLVVNMNLVLITYLQHTAPYIPHYRNVRFVCMTGCCAVGKGGWFACAGRV